MAIPGIGSTVTAQSIITRAARALGYLGRTETLSAADANDGLECLNAMLDSWAGEELYSWAVNTQSFPLVQGKQSYTIGDAPADIVATRPTNIDSAYLIDSNQLTYTVNVIPQDKWDAIGQKNITSQLPTTLFYDSQFPLGIINIFPVPLLVYTLYYQWITQQNFFTSLTTQLAAPPGYALAYIQNLALQLKSAGFPCLLNADDMGQLRENASIAKGNIKRTNIKEVIAEYDRAIVANSYATYNIYADGFPRN